MSAKGLNTAFGSVEVLQRVYWPTVFVHLKMQMRTCRASGAAAQADHLTGLDGLADMDENPGVMRVQRREAMLMLELDGFSICPIVPGIHHDPFLGSLDRGPGRDAEIDPSMEACSTSTHHTMTLPEGGGEVPLHRPDETRAGFDRGMCAALEVALHPQEERPIARLKGLVQLGKFLRALFEGNAQCFPNDDMTRVG